MVTELEADGAETSLIAELIACFLLPPASFSSPYRHSHPTIRRSNLMRTTVPNEPFPYTKDSNLECQCLPIPRWGDTPYLETCLTHLLVSWV